MKKNANKGFSLVELIIVIAIMAVLIGVLAPQFIKQVEKSRESTDLQNIEEIKTAIETLAAEKESAITATINWKSGTITVTLPSGTSLSEYGITTLPTTTKSKEWTECEWKYADYAWTITSGKNGQAKYYTMEGKTPTTTP